MINGGREGEGMGREGVIFCNWRMFVCVYRWMDKLNINCISAPSVSQMSKSEHSDSRSV